MKLILTAVSGSREGKVFTIEANECITFGRTNLSKWSFEDDGHMSSVHFEVANLGAVGEVRDHKSTNGTWLNNEKVTQAILRDGDRIRAGRTILTVEISNDLVQAELVNPDDSEGIEQTIAPTPIDELDLPVEQHQPRKVPDPATQKPLRSTGNTDFESLPISNVAEKVRKSNPFDSIDFAEFEEPAASEPSPLPTRQEKILSPISDSSFFGGPPITKIAQYELFARQTSVEASESFAIVLDSLDLKWSAQLVVHFQKVRIATPSEVDSKPILRDLTSPAVANYFPVRLAWNEANSEIVMPLLPRLCRADACIAFLGRSSMEIGSQLDAICSMGVEGFSEPNGFLPYFWPSCLISMVEARGKGICDQLFGGKISGVLLCAPFSRNEIFAIADRDFGEDLLAAKFRSIARLVGE